MSLTLPIVGNPGGRPHPGPRYRFRHLAGGARRGGARWRARLPAPARTPGFLVVPRATACRKLLPDRRLRHSGALLARPVKPRSSPYKIGALNIGYLPFGGQTVRHSPVNKNTRPNFSESFYITRDRAPDHPDIVTNKRALIGRNRWPVGHA